jgi:methylenetetrahydrofolate dehydrogenase (NADP+)/methenyltetrahydrofolate cyclohydrolase
MIMILYAKPYVDAKIKELKERVAKADRVPKLAIIQVGDNPASNKYVGNKIKRCHEVGIDVEHISYTEDVDHMTMVTKIYQLNNDDSVTGILVQLPLPEHLDTKYLLNQICPYKDVDGLTWYNTGRLSQGVSSIPPCTPKGIMGLLDYYNIPLEGKDVLIINDSDIVGKPLAQLMNSRGATVTVAHKRTYGIKHKIRLADIVVVGVGIPNFLNANDFAPNTTIIDVGINFVDGKMCGDVTKGDYDIISKDSNITPVPGGVGQTTVLALLETLVDLVEDNIF